MKETLNEKRVMVWNEEKQEIEVEGSLGVSAIAVDPERTARCDLCYCDMGKFKDLVMTDKNTCSPEKFAMAVKNGMEPPALLIDSIAKNRAEKRSMLRSWRNLAFVSETPWCLCEECMEKVKKYAKM